MRKRRGWFVVLIAAIGLLATGSVASAKQTTVTLTARLSGANEVPAADPDGSAKAVVMIDVAAGQVASTSSRCQLQGRRTAARFTKLLRA